MLPYQVSRSVGDAHLNTTFDHYCQDLGNEPFDVQILASEAKLNPKSSFSYLLQMVCGSISTTRRLTISLTVISAS
ncbi:hypothetical protein CASFOL_009237 [Castilleja foliolosa]|uniref:Uncharacterized protein n=1 Tax=Castilleja foliolosa TaxID=1961234 RepID=A0ABD3DWS2_9LAMI